MCSYHLDNPAVVQLALLCACEFLQLDQYGNCFLEIESKQWTGPHKKRLQRQKHSGCHKRFTM